MMLMSVRSSSVACDIDNREIDRFKTFQSLLSELMERERVEVLAIVFCGGHVAHNNTHSLGVSNTFGVNCSHSSTLKKKDYIAK